MDAMADVTCPLTFEDWRALLAHEALPTALRTILGDPARTIALAAVAKALRQELAGLREEEAGGRQVNPPTWLDQRPGR